MANHIYNLIVSRLIVSHLKNYVDTLIVFERLTIKTETKGVADFFGRANSLYFYVAIRKISHHFMSIEATPDGESIQDTLDFFHCTVSTIKERVIPKTFRKLFSNNS